MQLLTIADLDKYNRTEVEAFVRSLSPLEELKAWLETRNDPQVELEYQRVQAIRAARAAKREPTLRSTYRIEPSSIHQCTRKLWYQLMGEEKRERIGRRLRRIFDTGDAVHEQLQCYYECMWGDEFTDEVGVMIEDLYMSGHTDGERTTKDAHFLMEFKTIKHDGFIKLGNQPKKEHPQQFHCYMRAKDAPFGYIQYYDKDTSMMEEFAVIFAQHRWDSIQTRCEIAIEADDDGPNDTSVNRFVCGICAYSWTCPHRKGRY